MIPKFELDLNFPEIFKKIKIKIKIKLKLIFLIKKVHCFQNQAIIACFYLFFSKNLEYLNRALRMSRSIV